MSSFTNCASFPKRLGTPDEEPAPPELEPDEEFEPAEPEFEESVEEPELEELDDEFEFDVPDEVEFAGEAE